MKRETCTCGWTPSRRPRRTQTGTPRAASPRAVARVEGDERYLGALIRAGVAANA